MDCRGLSVLCSAVILVAFFGVQRQGRKQKRLAEVKSDFINNMSHEFKTPLATINLAVDALMKNGEKMTPNQMQSYLSIVKKENKRMNAQMESVLQMSMMDKEELTLDKAVIDIDWISSGAMLLAYPSMTCAAVCTFFSQRRLGLVAATTPTA